VPEFRFRFRFSTSTRLSLPASGQKAGPEPVQEALEAPLAAEREQQPVVFVPRRVSRTGLDGPAEVH
jgi:hypothetical protein